jgi:hypothetical protein
MVEAATKVEQLEQRLLADWSHLRRSRLAADERIAELRKVLAGLDSEDTSVVVSRSLARGEFTLAGCGKTPFFGQIRNSCYAESKTDYA